MMQNRLTTISRQALPGTGIFVTSRPHAARTRWQSLRCALQGLLDAWCTQPNLRMHLWVAIGVIGAGLWCRLGWTEWLWVSFAIGLVIFAELMNTAIEQTVNLVVGRRPDPLARHVKDVAAGCVLVAACLSVVIGALTFLPHLLVSLQHISGV